jgi:hypothetical protein
MVDYQQIESSQRQYHEEVEHQQRMEAAVISAEMALVATLKPSIYIDGDEWCVLLGENIQNGISGFGDTSYKAILNFNAEFNKSLK